MILRSTSTNYCDDWNFKIGFTKNQPTMDARKVKGRPDIVEKLSSSDIQKLTSVLNRRPNYGIAHPSAKWFERQEKKIRECLPQAVLAPDMKERLSMRIDKYVRGIPKPPAAVLCQSHKTLSPFLIRRILALVVAEVTLRTDDLRSWPRKSPSLAAFITRLDSVNAYWMPPDAFSGVFGANPRDDRLVRVENGCEACILAVVGGNGRTLADLRACLAGRKVCNYWTSFLEHPMQDSHRPKRRPSPRLLRVVEGWIDYLKPGDAAEVRSWSEDLIRELMGPFKSHKLSCDQEKDGKGNARSRRLKGSSGRRSHNADDIPYMSQSVNNTVTQRAMASLLEDADTSSIYPVETVIADTEEYEDQVPPVLPVPSPMRPSRYDSPDLSGGQPSLSADQKPCEGLADQFEYDISFHNKEDHNPYFRNYAGDQWLEEQFPEEEQHRQDISDWGGQVALAQSRVNMSQGQRGGIHPAFYPNVPTLYQVPSAAVQPLHLKQEEQDMGARAAWPKSDRAVQQVMEQFEEDHVDTTWHTNFKWAVGNIYTAGTIPAAGSSTKTPPMPQVPAKYRQKQPKRAADESDCSDPEYWDDGEDGETIPTGITVPSYPPPPPEPQISPIGNPDQSTISSPTYNNLFAQTAREPQPQQFLGPPHTINKTPPSLRSQPGNLNRTYLFEDSDLETKLTINNKKYLRSHKHGIKKEVTPDNPFVKNAVNRNANKRSAARPVPGPNFSAEEYDNGPTTSQAGGPRMGMPLSRETLEAQEQEWRESLGIREDDGESALGPDDSASNILWNSRAKRVNDKRESQTVTRLGDTMRHYSRKR
ncbi:uncharacterized protein BCR38DRAFT_97854 [Pseudomassariella vexata]|uniref:Uncharacterized protein n=1 Tax=Pseudomassariella vexata TaxID=1141098 RepID=A0A1Y2EEM1_9PEZI|nr:uncharacterized protein BCR38DRAFT_97854 [Pseudomassariella vexata]ORY70021.1 hypothetical protein BCR38DRAFT_97854 [Pseudomassariella vexata]